MSKILSVRMRSVREILLTLRLSESRMNLRILPSVSKEKTHRGLTLWMLMGRILQERFEKIRFIYLRRIIQMRNQ